MNLRLTAAIPLMLALLGGPLPSASGQAPPPDRGVFMLVHDTRLETAAEQWKSHREDQGWRVVMRPVEASDRQMALRHSILRDIRNAYESNGRPDPERFVVLLLGDTWPSARVGIPTWRVHQVDETMFDVADTHYATDHSYQCLDDDDLPDIPLGRVPARTDAEARIVLDKIRAFERASELGAWRCRVTYTAGEGHYGPADLLLESLFAMMIDRLVPEIFDLSMTYAKADSPFCPPPDALTETVLRRLGEPALLFNYVGHGQESGLDRLHWNGQQIPILQVQDVARLRAAPRTEGQRPIAFFSACSTGWFDLPDDEQCLAEALLMHPDGPVAVIAGSRITHPYANSILLKDITDYLLARCAPTVGELDLRAAHSLVRTDPLDREVDLIAAPVARFQGWPSTLPELRSMHVRLYNLLGDPATRITHMTPLQSFTMHEGVLSGQVGNMKRGQVEVTILTMRAAAHAGGLVPVHGKTDPDLPSKARHNYPLANDPVLTRLSGTVVDGAFRVALPDPLPIGAAIIKAYAIGVDEHGRPLDAVGALRLPAPDPIPSSRP